MSGTFAAVKMDGMDAVGRGEEIRARRIGHGMNMNDLAKISGVSRQTIARAESGHPSVEELTYARLERALSDFEEETGADIAMTVRDTNGTSGLVKFTIHGVYGAAEVIVEGPVENMAELQAAVDKLLRGQHERRDASSE